jgi:hypothetical protein
VQTELSPPPQLPDAPPPERRGARGVAVALLAILLFLYATLGALIVAGGGFLWGSLSGAPVLFGPIAWVLAMTVLIAVLIQVGRRRWRPAIGWVGLVAVALSFAVFPIENRVAYARSCTSERIQLLESIPTYGGQDRHVESMGEPCGYTVHTGDSTAKVMRFYEDQLRAAGWSVRSVHGSVEARKGGEHLSVEPPDAYAPPGVEVGVQVIVWPARPTS